MAAEPTHDALGVDAVDEVLRDVGAAAEACEVIWRAVELGLFGM